MVRDDPSPPPPSVADVRARIEQLIRGQITREDASAWALRWIDVRDSGEIHPTAWQGLLELAGADLPDLDREYLHGVEDFRAWRDALAAHEL